MDLLEVLGLSRPVADCAICVELYYDGLKGDCAQDLDALKLRCMQLLQPYVEGYIWQHDPLSLHSSLQQQPPWMLKGKGSRHPHEPQAKRQAAEQQPPFLWGVLRYEDSVEDEWFVVWLLLQLTQQLVGCTARCWDDDGEFLLIEAAYSLPRWLKPETASNRVWLRGGQVHIIPPPSARHPSLPANPSVSEALAVLHSGAVETRRKRVEACVMERLAGYPSLAQQQLQRTAVWLPRRLGVLLQIDPQQVSAAVAAFMTRQRDEVQAVSKGRLFPPSDMTTALVCLNRCMYAQLMQADFAAPKGYPTPPSSSWLGGDSSTQHKAVSMGLKLTTGMELMALRLGIQPQAPAAGAAGGDASVAAVGRIANSVSSPSGQDQQQQAVQQEGQALQQQQQQQPQQQQPQQQTQQQQQQQQQQRGQEADLASNPAWHAYKGVLQRSGYFDGELEGSARYRQLLQAAADAFTRSEAYSQSTALLEAPKQRLQQLLATADAAAQAAAAVGDSVTDTAAQPQQQQQQQEGWGRSPLAAVLDVDRQQGLVVEDGDEWMAAEAEQLQQRLEAAEQLVATHTSKKQHKQQEPAATAAAEADASAAAAAADVDAEQLVSGFRSFVQHMAGVEGAEVPTVTPPAAAAAAGREKGRGGSVPGHAGAAPTSSRAGGKQQGQRHKQSHKQRSAAAAAAAASELDFNPDAFLSELFGVLGAVGGGLEQQQQQQTPAQAAALLQQAKALHDKLEQQLAAFPGADTGSGNDPFDLFSSAAVAAAAAGAAGAAGDGLDSDDYGSSGSGSSEEGSSFYGSDSEEDEGLDEGLGRRGQAATATAAVGMGDKDEGPVFLDVPPPVSHISGGGQPGSEQQQHSRRHQRSQQQQQPGQQQQQQPAGSSWVHPDAWEVMTATDSDDDADDDALSLGGSSSDGSNDDLGSEDGVGLDSSAAAAAAAAGRNGGFHDSYSAAMEAELAATTMAQTFERVRLSPAADPAGTAGTAAASSTAAGTSATATAAAELDAGLTPLDIDMNLIKSLVASYTAQGGLPGPASNLAGLLGLQLPTEAEVQEEGDRAGEGQ